MGALYIISSLFSWLQQIWLVKVSQHTVHVLRKDLFDRIQLLPLRFFDSKPHGELMSRLTNDVDNVSNMLSQSMTQVMSSCITLVVSLVMMLTLSWELTLVSLAAIPLSMVIVRQVTGRTGKLFKEQQAALGELNGIVEETVTGARVVKVFGREPNVIADFEKSNEKLTKVGVKATVLSSVMGPLMNAVNNISFALVAGIGGWMAISGRVSVAASKAFAIFAPVRPAVQRLANQITVVQSALAGAERVFEIMDTEPEPEDDPRAYLLDKPKGHVVFEDVSFGYTPEK